MDHQQPLSGDLKQIQRQHQLHAEKSQQSNHRSASPTNPPPPPSSLLQRRQSSRQTNDEEYLGNMSPMPTGAERMAALRDLGATFEEGKKSIAKVATPTETVVPSFVDSDQLEILLHKKNNSNLTEVCKNTVAH